MFIWYYLKNLGFQIIADYDQWAGDLRKKMTEPDIFTPGSAGELRCILRSPVDLNDNKIRKNVKKNS
jgi:hypothetical protein